MRLRVVWMLVLLMLGMAALRAQEIPAEVVKAWNKGDLQALSPFLGQQGVLVLDHQSANLKKPEMERKLSQFFAGNPVYGFRVNHQGKRDGSCFVIGTLATKSGLYRVNCFFRREGEKYVIHQIRIDKTNNE